MAEFFANAGGVSCPSTTFCVAVRADGGTAMYNGTTWITQANGGGSTANNLLDVSCPSSTFCAAVGNQGTIVQYNGSAWSAASSPTTVPLTSVSCPSSAFCVAVGNTFTFSGGSGATIVVGTATGGSPTVNTRTAIATIQPSGLPSGSFFDQVSCPTTTFCTAVGGTSTSGGLIVLGTVTTGPNVDTWTVVQSAAVSRSGLPSGSSFTRVSCVNSSDCVVVGSTCTATCNTAPVIAGTIVATTNAGANWTLQQIGSKGINDVSCLPGVGFSHCEAVGNNATLLGSTDGSTWTAQTNPTGVQEPFISTVSCVNAGFCLAASSSGPAAFLQFNGAQWTTKFLDFGLQGVACVGTTFCEAVGQGLEIFNGASWSTQTDPTVYGINLAVSGVSCPSTTFCAAVGGDSGSGTSAVAQYDGTSWTFQDSPRPSFWTA